MAGRFYGRTTVGVVNPVTGVSSGTTTPKNTIPESGPIIKMDPRIDRSRDKPPVQQPQQPSTFSGIVSEVGQYLEKGGGYIGVVNAPAGAILYGGGSLIDGLGKYSNNRNHGPVQVGIAAPSPVDYFNNPVGTVTTKLSDELLEMFKKMFTAQNILIVAGVIIGGTIVLYTAAKVAYYVVGTATGAAASAVNSPYFDSAAALAGPYGLAAVGAKKAALKLAGRG